MKTTLLARANSNTRSSGPANATSPIFTCLPSTTKNGRRFMPDKLNSPNKVSRNERAAAIDEHSYWSTRSVAPEQPLDDQTPSVTRNRSGSAAKDLTSRGVQPARDLEPLFKLKFLRKRCRSGAEAASELTTCFLYGGWQTCVGSGVPCQSENS